MRRRNVGCAFEVYGGGVSFEVIYGCIGLRCFGIVFGEMIGGIVLGRCLGRCVGQGLNTPIRSVVLQPRAAASPLSILLKSAGLDIMQGSAGTMSGPHLVCGLMSGLARTLYVV